jgi:SAM-dependent methyltransferase
MQADYDAIAPAFAASRRDMHWPELDAMVASIEPHSRVLDAGCGMGRLYNQLKAKEVSYLGVDVSAEQIRVAKQEQPDGQFVQGTMTDLPAGKGSQDAVFMVASLHHLLTPADRLSSLQEAYRVLVPGGKLFITVMGLWQPKFWRLFFSKQEGLASMQADERKLIRFADVFLPWQWRTEKTVYRYYHAFRIGELRRLCEQAGFTVQTSEYVRDGKRVRPWQAKNLVVIAQKPL